ncbi:MAG: hypothetical protein J6L75_04940, partial [Alistipes sp.]|nr:hypothetical protein [Alistipes sp.]
NSKFKIQNYLAGAAVMTATYIVMPQFTYAGHYRYVLRYICKLTGIYLWELPPHKYALGSKG